MELNIENFAKIKEANIIIDGITVIAGENNTGKSTVGKILFSIFNSLNNIEDVQFYDNVKFEIVPNGYRWGNDDYYSGDANVNIKKGKKTLKYIYKGKVYINANNKSYIVLNEKGASKSYVFNLGTKKKTKQMYYELLEHAH